MKHFFSATKNKFLISFDRHASAYRATVIANAYAKTKHQLRARLALPLRCHYTRRRCIWLFDSDSKWFV